MSDQAAPAPASAAGKKIPKPKKKNRVDGYSSVEEAIATWEKCIHIMKDRNKFCNQHRASGSRYCGNHRPEDEAVSSARRVADAQHAGVGVGAIRRVPCPLDSNHTVYEHELAHHLKV